MRKRVLSPKALAARRKNAQKSTGPKTAEGKRAVAMNAFKHGLSSRIVRDKARQEQIDALARQLASERQDQKTSTATQEQSTGQHGGSDDAGEKRGRMDVAYLFAEAHLDLERVRAVKMEVIQANHCTSAEGQQDSSSYFETDRLKTPSLLLKLDRYEQRALSKRNQALRVWEEVTRP